MFKIINQVCIILLSFSRCLATKRVSLNNEPCITRSSLVDLNPVKLKYCNAVDDVSTKICVPNQTKSADVKILNVIKELEKNH